MLFIKDPVGSINSVTQINLLLRSYTGNKFRPSLFTQITTARM